MMTNRAQKRDIFKGRPMTSELSFRDKRTLDERGGKRKRKRERERERVREHFA